jgi:transcriptional regulator with XRE-family HTH domain
MAKTLVERIKAAMEKEGIKSYAEISRRGGGSPNSLTAWVESGEIPRGASRLALANALNVNVEWLRTGEGAMEAPESITEKELASTLEEADQVVLNSLSFTSRFMTLFELDLSDQGQMTIALRFGSMWQALKVANLRDIPPANMGAFVENILKRVHSGEIK